MASESGPIYFWHETEEPYGFLSQWFSSEFTAPAPTSVSEGTAPLVFVTTEQYMMYRKAILFNDGEIAEMIMQESNPREQKALGRLVKGFDNKVWNRNREGIVEEGNWHKFTQQKRGDLKRSLLETGERELVEVCAVDHFPDDSED